MPAGSVRLVLRIARMVLTAAVLAALGLAGAALLARRRLRASGTAEAPPA